MRGHVLRALIVGFQRDLDGLVVLDQRLLDQVRAGDAVGRALVQDAELLVGAAQGLAEFVRFDIVGDADRENIGAGRLVAAVGIGHGRSFSGLRVAHRPAVRLHHVDHGEDRSAARGRDQAHDVLVVQDAAHVLYGTIGHELVVESFAELHFVPPALLASSIAISAPRRTPSPNSLNGPVSAAVRLTLMVSCAWAAPESASRQARLCRS